jgi:uncharacterized protein (TIGR03083 family)
LTETPWIVAASTAPALTAQLSEEWAALIDVGSLLTDEEWHSPTACPGWDVAAQYAHMIGTESSLAGLPGPDVDPGSPAHVKNPIGKANEVWVAGLGSLSRSEVLGRFREVTDQRMRALRAMGEEEFSAPSWTPVGDADYRRFMQTRVFDCWVHEQDIRDAIGRPGHDSGPVAEQAVDEIFRVIGYLVGKRASAPDGSSLRIRLSGPVEREVLVVARDGRAGAVAALDGEPSSTLSLSSNAFVRLACGRVDPQAVLSGALGGAEYEGDLAFRLVSNLAFTI